MQNRAETTRQMIVDTAVELFDRDGYANVSLSELIASAGLSKGAFYYHFPNREAVTAAIIAQADDALQEATREHLADPSLPALGNLIRAVFAVAEITRANSLVRVGVQLRGAVGQLSTAQDGFDRHRQLFTDVVRAGVAEGDLPPDSDVDRVGHTLWSAVLGTHQHCDATGEDIQARLADVLRTLLPAICAPDSARRYGELVDGLVAGRQPAAED